MKNTLEAAIRANGLDTDIRNIVFQLIRNTVKAEFKSTLQSVRGNIFFVCISLWYHRIFYWQADPLNYLRRAGIQWERRVRKSLNAMCNELQVTLQGQQRQADDKLEFQNKWAELGSYQVDLTNYRPVYAPKDLLEVLLSLKGPHRQEDE